MLHVYLYDTATTRFTTLSLHDALPISHRRRGCGARPGPSRTCGAAMAQACACRCALGAPQVLEGPGDRKSTRLNSSHLVISYAVFCLKKKKQSHERMEMSQESDEKVVR